MLYTFGGILAFIIFICAIMNRKLKGGLFSFMLKNVVKYSRTHPLVHAVTRVLSDRKPPTGLPHLDTVEYVSGRAVRILGFNPGSHTLQGTNTYLIGSASEKILVDTGENFSSQKYVGHLFDVVFPATKTTSLKCILLTHGHGDHLGGVSDILKECAKRRWPIPSIHKKLVQNGDFPPVGFTAEHIANDEVFGVEGATIRTIYTPGHTDDHVCFVLEEDKALLSGDCILGCGTAVFDDLHTYMKSLKLLRSHIVGGVPAPKDSTHHSSSVIPVEHIYPGHGPIVGRDVLQKIDEYIFHRELREKQICNALKDSIWLSSWDIVCKVYPSSLPFHIKLSAQINVIHHLEKLVADDVVKPKWPDLWTLVENK